MPAQAWREFDVQMRILIADDNAVIRKVLRKVLEARQGWTVCCEAEDGLDAIEHAKQCQPDLILLDLAMPYVNGLVAAGKISRLLPSRPVIILTLYDSPEIQAEAKNLGVLQVIPKTDGHSLIAAIESLVQGPRPNITDGEALSAPHRQSAANAEEKQT